MNEGQSVNTTSRSTIVEEAMANVSGIAEPELKKIAFEAELKRLGDSRKRWERWIGWVAGTLGVVGAAVGIAVSLASVLTSWRAGIEVRKHENETRQRALLQPSLDLQRERYLDILSTLGKIAADDQDPKTLAAAKRRFWELYWADLSLVEDDEVKNKMQELGGMLKKGDMSEFQQATYQFAGLIRKRIINLDDQMKTKSQS